MVSRDLVTRPVGRRRHTRGGVHSQDCLFLAINSHENRLYKRPLSGRARSPAALRRLQASWPEKPQVSKHFRLCCDGCKFGAHLAVEEREEDEEGGKARLAKVCRRSSLPKTFSTSSQMSGTMA